MIIMIIIVVEMIYASILSFLTFVATSISQPRVVNFEEN